MHASGDNPAVVRQVMMASATAADYVEKPAKQGIHESLVRLEENLQRLDQLVS